MKNVGVIVVATVVIVIVLKMAVEKVFGMMFPVQGKITSPYGPRKAPKAGASTFHNGIDIAVPVGTPILAPADGKVISQWTDAGGGISMKVQFTNGFFAGFAHLSGYKAKVGDKFKRGQQIAKSGNTGNSTGPHLHLTMRDPKGNLVDPQKHLV